MYLLLFLSVIFLVVVGMLWNEGLWGNAITLINLVLAAMLATNYFEPLADWLDEMIPSYTYLLDFLAIWTLFFIIFNVLRAITDWLSRHKVRFKLPVEQGGRIVVAILAGWVMICFTTMTLHLAPLARNSFGGAFQKTPESGNFFGTSPDRYWLAFVQSRSRGALARGGQTDSPYEEDKNLQVFDPHSEFIFKYGSRRENFENEPALRVNR